MQELISTEEKKEKFILVAVSISGEKETQSSLDELDELVYTAGAMSVGRLVQNRERIHAVTYLGKGKLEELKEMLLYMEADGVLCDDELSPAQLRNLERILDTKIVDRTMLILDIFAKRASTGEGKIQVELAQLKYAAVRLVGLRSSLSRLGGGIGTRGPGEKKIELDRRLIHNRISVLKEELREVKKQRDIRRKARKDNFVIAIVGYTNAGKSTFLNKLTGADVLAEDKLFATLDPTTRKLKLPSGNEVLLTDTVGFIRKLPHHLIEAFKSTLEEAKYADLILHMIDASNPEADTQMLIVYNTLRELGIEDKEVVSLYNKIDIMPEDTILPRDFHAEHTLKISAKTGEGLEEFKELVDKILRQQRIYLEKLIPYKDSAKLALIRKHGELELEDYREDGIYIKAMVPTNIYDLL
ncbi:MAG: GTPase HflX [Lachnospiraceae bacterium]|nr:MAG: GTPase HflX [Lachnospiraceae bacterium]